jgi:hypothetical protein
MTSTYRESSMPSLRGYPIDQDLLLQNRQRQHARRAQRRQREAARNTLARRLLHRLRRRS